MKKFLYIRNYFLILSVGFPPFQQTSPLDWDVGKWQILNGSAMKMNKVLYILSLILLCGMTACHDDHGDDGRQEQANRTIIMYFPWSGTQTSKGLYNLIKYNVAEIQDVIASKEDSKLARFVCFMSDSPSTAVMYEMTKKRNDCVCDTFIRYEDPDLKHAEGIAEIFRTAMERAPADHYGVVVGCHGMGWLPTSVVKEVKTRYFGGLTKEFATDLSEFARALEATGKKMDYVLFDDCYMANVEVAYEMRNATDYLIASPNEVMDRGVPYAQVFQYLMGSPDYERFVNGFYNFYYNYHYPYGTMSVTDCNKIQDMADLMKRINSKCTLDTSLLNKIQPFDTHQPTLFYDFGDYVRHLCTDANLLAEFEAELKELVPFAKATDYVYCVAPIEMRLRIRSFSGLSISDPSENSWAESKVSTPWYLATH